LTTPTGQTDWIEVPLHRVAHARTGDKGNRINISLIPYHEEAYNILGPQVTSEKVLALFAHRGATAVRRYDLPLIHAFNFVVDDVLEGGVNGSLNLDGHGKSHSFRLLSIAVRVPERLVIDPEPRDQPLPRPHGAGTTPPNP
jgi:hypothetical protein